MKKTVLFCISFIALVFPGCGGSPGESLPLITPTIYYKPVIDKSKDKCESNDLRDMIDEDGKVLISLCQKSYDNCQLQGSCFVIDGDKTRAFNFTKRKAGISRFAEKHEDRCPYGYGVRAICLDPFYSIAADMSFYQPGDVIYVPKLVGVVLPDGSKHNGYLVVRDEGGAIIGENRFDFFTGFYGPYDKDNVFAQIGFGDKDRQFGYERVDENIAKRIREYRNYPNIP